LAQRARSCTLKFARTSMPGADVLDAMCIQARSRHSARYFHD
jgi:hypothetical protein